MKCPRHTAREDAPTILPPSDDRVTLWLWLTAALQLLDILLQLWLG